jgi:hypothetical protein
MARGISKIGDRLLGSLLKTVDAGACCPETGDRCGTYTHTTCSEHIKTTRWYWLERACSCSCTVQSGIPTGQVQTSHC